MQRGCCQRDGGSGGAGERFGLKAGLGSIIFCVGASLAPSALPAIAAPFAAPAPSPLAGPGPVQFQGDLCEDLWRQRNMIYRAAGYCFRTPRAIAAFGNAGCMYDRKEDVPLSLHERRQVQAIRSEERRLGCRS